MSKLKYVVAVCMVICACVVGYGAVFEKDYVTPESFGAKGDGKSDDAPAFNNCLKTGKTIKLTANKNYLLQSEVAALKNEMLVIEGNGAKMTISEKYPVKENSSIFYLGVPRKKILKVTDLDIDYLLGQKFDKSDARGDTYMFAVQSCEDIVFRNVNFKAEKHYNNVSFLRDNGSRNLLMDGCRIIINTLSVQGGILWFQNIRDSICTVSLKNSYFEHDVKDECMCFNVSPMFSKKTCNMRVEIDSCEFYSAGKGKSSGFIIVSADSKKTYSTMDVNYRNTTFRTDGDMFRQVQRYQICSGDSDYDYGVFRTTFEKCKFDFLFKSPKKNGLCGIIYSKGTSMPTEAISYEFNECEFNLKNVSPLIDDRDSRRKGCYTFNKCKIVSDGVLFVRKFRPGKDDIRLKLENCEMVSNDEVFSTEQIEAKNCKFTNKMKGNALLMDKKYRIQNCVVNGVSYK